MIRQHGKLTFLSFLLVVLYGETNEQRPGNQSFGSDSG